MRWNFQSVPTEVRVIKWLSEAENKGLLVGHIVKDGPAYMIFFQECEHEYVGKQVGGPPDVADSTEWIEFCKHCGFNKVDD